MLIDAVKRVIPLSEILVVEREREASLDPTADEGRGIDSVACTIPIIKQQ